MLRVNITTDIVYWIKVKYQAMDYREMKNLYLHDTLNKYIRGIRLVKFELVNYV